jgi:hypothetical protein
VYELVEQYAAFRDRALKERSALPIPERKARLQASRKAAQKQTSKHPAKILDCFRFITNAGHPSAMIHIGVFLKF